MSFLASQKIGETIKVVAQTDESMTSNASLTNDPELFFESGDIKANWFIDVCLIITCASATPDLKYDFNNVGSSWWMAGGHRCDLDVSGLRGSLQPGSSGHLANTTVTLSGTSAQQFVKFQTIYIPFTNTGTIYIQWAQVTSDATAIVRKAGSYLMARKTDDGTS